MKIRVKVIITIIIIIIEETITTIPTIVTIVTVQKKIIKSPITTVGPNDDKSITVQVTTIVVNLLQHHQMIPILKKILILLRRFTSRKRTLKQIIVWKHQLKPEFK